ncbi:MAG: glycosyltransferase [Acidimicrobiia bacterium]
MLRLAGLVAQATLILLALYNAVTALWGWPDRDPAGPGSGRRRLRVVVPAHDEAKVIASLLGDLARVDYPDDLRDVWVLADRSRDETVKMARARGVEVAERVEGEGGKGAALAWYLENHPLDEDEALVVFDADNRVPPEALRRIADEIDAGHQALQCYLDVTEAKGSLLAEASALSYWAGNRMVQLARSNLGWSADLGGTGMAITSRAIADAGGFATSLTEDQDLGVRLLLAGHRVEWVHDVRIADEKPRSLQAAVRQRARWMAGKRAARRRHLGGLLGGGLSPDRLDMAIRLVQPGRSFVALVSGLLTVGAALTQSEWLLPWQVWASATAVQVLQPIPFLAREGVPGRQLVRYPLLALLAALWLPIRVVSTRVGGWYHTPHRGTTPSDDEPGPAP